MFRKVGICVLLYALLALVSWDAARAQGRDRCAGSEISELNTSQFHSGGDACFVTYAPSAGLLMLEANVPSAADTEAKLEFLGASCEGSRTAKSAFRYKDRLANSAWIEVRQAGDFYFCVEAQDPSLEIGEYQLVNGFLPAVFSKTDPDEDEPEPDPFADPRGGYKTDPDEDEPEPDPFTGRDGCLKTDPDEDEPEPDPFTDMRPTLEGVCQQMRMDDHGDALGCATPIRLGQGIQAMIRSDLGHDQDFFTFRVEELTTVRVEITGAGDTVGSLYDPHGYRLKVDDDGGHVRIVKTLSPGRYFIRVEGYLGARDAYRLTVEGLPSEP